MAARIHHALRDACAVATSPPPRIGRPRDLSTQEAVAQPRDGTGIATKTIVSIERAIETAVRTVASILLVFEVLLLFVGVICRYVFNQPLVWSDELASVVFLWLAMFGATLAFQRGQHMRMTWIRGTLNGRAHLIIEALAVLAPLLFLALIIRHSYVFAVDEGVVTMPALNLPNSWRAFALPVGFGMMFVLGLLRVLRMTDWRATAIGVAILAILVGGLVAGTPVFALLGKWNLVIFFIGAVGLGVFSGIPIAFSFGLATFGYLALTTRTPLVILVGRLDEGMSHLILLAIPLFIFLGYLMEATGMARVMLTFLSALVGHLRGGLSYVLIGAMYLVSGISGSKTADMAAIAPGLIPEMRAHGEKPGELTALLAATGAQTETIPPSLALIAISSAAGVSTSALFIGGFMPGLVMGIILCGLVSWRTRSSTSEPRKRAPLKTVLASFAIAFPAILLPFVIRTAVVEGAATATEVSTIGVFYTLLASFLFYERISWSCLLRLLASTASLAGAVLFVVGAATGMAWALTQSGASRDLAAVLTHLPGGAFAFIAASIVIFVVVGAVLEGIPAIVLLTPLLLPIAKTLGIHEVHYSMIAILSMGIGYFAPPLGIGYYTSCAIANVHPNEGLRPMIVYTAALLLGLCLVAAVPWFSTGFLN
ncbi:MAG TPA: TRAP transporter large permease subunit [Stellaceae bacterium]|nr:TRAP transporter large permease subunit [Stellaceae bacterium]